MEIATNKRKKESNLYTIDADGVLTLSPHIGQAKVLTMPLSVRFILMLAGSQGGKTSLGPWWLNYEIERVGRGDYIAATTNFDLFKLKMLPETRRIFEDVLKIGRYWPGNRILEIRDPETGRFLAKKADDEMWARIILRSAESPSGMESLSAKAAWLDEVGQDAWDVNIWEAILRRLSLAQGRVLGTTTVYNSGWTKSEWYDRWAAGDKQYAVVQFNSVDNPSFPEAEYERAKRTLPDYKFKMFYQGMFDRPPGLILGDFKETMVVDTFGKDDQGNEIVGIPTDWKVVVGVDFGGANTSTIWLTQNPYDGCIYAYRETLEGDMPTSEHVQKAKDFAGYGIIRCVFWGGAPGETQQRLDWGTEGIVVNEPVVSDVESGIAKMIEVIKLDKFRILRHLSGLRHEINTYKRKIDESGNTTNEIENKGRFHRIDGLRYSLPVIANGISSWDDVSDLGKSEQGTKGTFDTENRFIGRDNQIEVIYGNQEDVAISPFR